MKNGFVKVAAMAMKLKVADPKHNADMICQKLLEAYEKDDAEARYALRRCHRL